VAKSYIEMSKHTHLPITVKCRIGVDDHDDYSFTHSFIKTVSEAGCRHFIVHARKAFLKGLSPAQNRTVPPLKYL
jgi:tRNA-dihydrouridine synthase A